MLWHSCLTIFLAPACCLPLVAQQTWRVHCGGAYGAHFTDLPAAVAAAAPNDTILVYGGVGPCAEIYTAPTIDKPLRIVGFLVGVPPGNNTPTRVQVRGPWSISGIDAGEQLVISDVLVRHIAYPPPFGDGVGSPITIANCQGSVVIENLFFSCRTPAQWLEIDQCAHVVLRGCDFRLGGGPLRVIDSNVLLTTTLVTTDPPDAFHPYTGTTESLFVQRSTVTLAGSIVEGAGPMGALPPRNAALVDNGVIRIGASSLLRGGPIPGAPSPPLPGNFAVSYLYLTPAPSAVDKDWRAPTFNFHPAMPPTTVTVDETIHDWIVADEDFQVRVNGPQGGTALLAVGEMAFPVPTPLGELGLPLHTMMLLDVVPLPASNGSHTWTMHCPSWIPNGFVFAYQCLTISPAGQLAITLPSPATVAWDKDRLP
jgi:hypothetical protein